MKTTVREGGKATTVSVVLRPTERGRNRRRRKRCNCRGEEAECSAMGVNVFAISGMACEREGRENEGNVGKLKISLIGGTVAPCSHRKLFF